MKTVMKTTVKTAMKTVKSAMKAAVKTAMKTMKTTMKIVKTTGFHMKIARKTTCQEIVTPVLDSNFFMTSINTINLARYNLVFFF